MKVVVVPGASGPRLITTSSSPGVQDGIFSAAVIAANTASGGRSMRVTISNSFTPAERYARRAAAA